jgi:hypothetical protein
MCGWIVDVPSCQPANNPRTRNGRMADGNHILEFCFEDTVDSYQPLSKPRTSLPSLIFSPLTIPSVHRECAGQRQKRRAHNQLRHTYRNSHSRPQQLGHNYSSTSKRHRLYCTTPISPIQVPPNIQSSSSPHPAPLRKTLSRGKGAMRGKISPRNYSLIRILKLCSYRHDVPFSLSLQVQSSLFLKLSAGA